MPDDESDDSAPDVDYWTNEQDYPGNWINEQQDPPGIPLLFSLRLASCNSNLYKCQMLMKKMILVTIFLG